MLIETQGESAAGLHTCVLHSCQEFYASMLRSFFLDAASCIQRSATAEIVFQ